MNDAAKSSATSAAAPVPTSLRRHLMLSGLVRDTVSLKRATDAESEDAARQRLLDRLTRLHGLPQKIGQLIAMGEMSDEEGPRLQLAGSPVLTLEEVESILADELPGAQFAWIDETAIPASLGQVHRARLQDGRDVAIKVQYPGIGSSVETDLKCLGWLTKPFGNLRRGFSIDAYRCEVGEMLAEELDYRREASTLHKYAQRFASYPQLDCPAPIAELCSDHVITMTWVEGTAVEACRGWGEEAREQAARQLLKFFLLGILEWNEIFADAHPGNFRFLRDANGPILGVVDFGCVRALDEGMATALHRLMSAAADGTIEDMSAVDLLDLYVTAGFDRDLLEPMAARLPAITELLFEPFGAAQPFRVGQWRLKERAAEVLGEHRWNFRVAGPPALLSFIRAYHGLVKHLELLAPSLDWKSVFAEVRPALDPVSDRRESAHNSSAANTSCGTVLRIRVQKNGRIQADLTFKGHLAGDLPDLIPPHLVPGIEQRGIDVKALADGAIRTGFAPADLFQYEGDGKTLRVWLEKGGNTW